MPRLLNRARVVAALVLVGASAAFAQDYPSRPVRMIVTFPPGGGADIVARALTPHFPEQTGQQLVIENRSGGSGIIGMELAAKAPPDGYTLVVGITGTLAINPSMFAKLPYDPVRDFTPISLVAVGPNTLVAHPSLPVQSVKDLIALAKQRPGTLSYASSGTGGAPHLAGELFKYMAHVDLVHIPYKGAAPATTDVLGGHVPLMFAGMGASIPYIKTGKLRALGVAAPKRSSQLPSVPAIAEFLPGFSAETWFGVLGPRGLNAPVVGRLSSVIKTTASRQDVRDQLLAGGYEVVLKPPAEFADFISVEVKKWAAVIRSAGIKPE
jgi:tripartite-type tricarboxylate transporter receptor subunit TctC